MGGDKVAVGIDHITIRQNEIRQMKAAILQTQPLHLPAFDLDFNYFRSSHGIEITTEIPVRLIF
jgi:hypothetical protein